MAKLDGKVDLWTNPIKAAYLEVLSIIYTDENALMSLPSVLAFSMCPNLIVAYVSAIKVKDFPNPIRPFGVCTLPHRCDLLEVLELEFAVWIEGKDDLTRAGPVFPRLQRLILPHFNRKCQVNLQRFPALQFHKFDGYIADSVFRLRHAVPGFEVDLGGDISGIRDPAAGVGCVKKQTSASNFGSVAAAQRRVKCLKITLVKDYESSREHILSCDFMQELELLGCNHPAPNDPLMGSFPSMTRLTLTNIRTTLRGDNFPQLKSLTCVDGKLKLVGDFNTLRSLTLKNTTFEMDEKSTYPLLQSYSFDRVYGMNKVLVSRTRFPLLQEVSQLHSDHKDGAVDYNYVPDIRPVPESDCLLPMILKVGFRLNSRVIDGMKAYLQAWLVLMV